MPLFFCAKKKKVNHYLIAINLGKGIEMKKPRQEECFNLSRLNSLPNTPQGKLPSTLCLSGQRT